MSKNALIRIILWSIVLILLLGILIAGIGFGNLFSRSIRNWDSEEPSVSTDWNGGEATSSCEFAADDIHNLKVEWVSGKIILQPDDTADTIRVMAAEYLLA